MEDEGKMKLETVCNRCIIEGKVVLTKLQTHNASLKANCSDKPRSDLPKQVRADIRTLTGLDRLIGMRTFRFIVVI